MISITFYSGPSIRKSGQKQYSRFIFPAAPALPSAPCRPALAAAPRRHLFTLHYSLFTIHSQPGRKFGALSHLRPPFLFLPAGEKETRRARCKGKRGAGMQVKMDPCSYKLVFVLCGKRMQVWCKPECPTLLFPLPLPWCARESCKGPTGTQRASGWGR